MSARDYYHHDSSDLNADLIEWDPPPVAFEFNAGVCVEHQELRNPGHITGHWYDPEEVR